jgi:hypothetical protein
MPARKMAQKEEDTNGTQTRLELPVAKKRCVHGSLVRNHIVQTLEHTL